MTGEVVVPCFSIMIDLCRKEKQKKEINFSLVSNTYSLYQHISYHVYA